MDVDSPYHGGMHTDLLLAWRTLTRRPGSSSTAIVTLALGLAAAICILQLAVSVLIEPLPFPEPSRLLSVWSTVERDTVERRSMSWPDVQDLAREARALSSVAPWSSTSVDLTGDGPAERLSAERVGSEWFEILGVAPLIGSVPSDPSEVLVSHALWQRRFGGSDLLGEAILIAGEPRVVVGITPPGFTGLSDAQLWLLNEPDSEASRGSRFLEVLAKLAPGATLEGAQQEIVTLFAQLSVEYPESNTGYSATARPLAEDIVGSLDRPVQLLLGAVALLLLVACSSVANLVLVRNLGRQRELAVCAALGAGRARLLRRTLVESGLMALGAAALALPIATAGLAFLERSSLLQLPAWSRLEPSAGPVLAGLALALACGAVIAFAGGASSALAEGGSRLADALRGRSDSPGTLRLRRALLVAEVALAVVLSLGAALLLRSFERVRAIDAGFEADELAIFAANLPRGPEGEEREARSERVRALQQRMQDQIGSLPGVESFALASDAPLSQSSSGTLISTEDSSPDPEATYGGAIRVFRHSVSREYFETLGIPIRRGRVFDHSDRSDSPAVAVIDEELARSLGGDEAVGRRFKLGRPLEPTASPEQQADIEWVQVIGIVPRVRHRNLVPSATAALDPDVYFFNEQLPTRTIVGIARTSGSAENLLPVLEERASAIHPEMPVFRLETMTSRRARQSSTASFSASLTGAFAGVALLLALVGLHGVLATAVGQRGREIGVRMALGAEPGQVARGVIAEAALTVGIGLAIGTVALLLLQSGLRSQLYEIGTTDPVAWLVTISLFVAVALVGAWLPARRAARIDAAEALRAD